MSKYKHLVLLASAWLGAVRLCLAGYGGIRLGCLGYGNRIRKYGKARPGAEWPDTARIGAGVVSLGQHRRGMEIELENKKWPGTSRFGPVRKASALLGLA